MAQKDNQLVTQMDDMFAKAPALPASAKEVLVTITPWVALIFGVLGIFAGLAGIGLLTAFSGLIALGSGVQSAAGSIVGAVLTLVSSVLMVMAFPKLNKHMYAGWMLLFWSEVVSVVSSLVALNIIGAIIGGLISFYILFQIRSYYK
jgi:hypothetical protein